LQGGLRWCGVGRAQRTSSETDAKKKKATKKGATIISLRPCKISPQSRVLTGEQATGPTSQTRTRIICKGLRQTGGNNGGRKRGDGGKQELQHIRCGAWKCLEGFNTKKKETKV